MSCRSQNYRQQCRWAPGVGASLKSLLINKPFCDVVSRWLARALFWAVVLTAPAVKAETFERRSSTLFLQYSAVGVGVVTAWGAANWDYFSRRPHTRSEGWFSESTHYGGMDKLGHVFSSYATSQFLVSEFGRHQMAPAQAAMYGALSSLVIMSYMEFGDAFSDYGFSIEDFWANIVGAGLGYWRAAYPHVAEHWDLRWEYGLHAKKSDILTDYENSKYLLAYRAEALEWHVGYYARGFSESRSERERYFYVGMGLNLSAIWESFEHHKTATFFQYFQAPYTYVAKDYRQND